MGDLTRNFSKSEFACKCGCGLDTISPILVDKLQRMRDYIERPIRVNSGVRCAEHNRAEGGVDGSEHVPDEESGFGEGADIECLGSSHRYEMLDIAFKSFLRIGIGKDFLHLGIRQSKAQEVAWLYEGPKNETV